MLSTNTDEQYIEELTEYVGIPSVSRDATPEVMHQAASWLVSQLGFANARVEETGGHPLVRGEWIADRRRTHHPRLRSLRRTADGQS